MSRIKSPSVLLLAALTLSLTIFTGCGSPPKNGVQVKLEADLTDSQLESLKDKLKALAPSANNFGHMSINGKISINLSPVSDVQKYADSITFATVDNVNVGERTVSITVDPTTLE